MLRRDDLSDEEKNEYYYDPFVLGNETIKRSEIHFIEIINSLDDAGNDAWDVSAAEDGSVLAWTQDDINGWKKLFIGGPGGVAAPIDSSYLFARYENLEGIAFNNCFYTDATTSMKYMFNRCGSLAELDISGFKTGNVTALNHMFSGCESLASLDVASFDTSKAVNMQGMFQDCTFLQKLDLSGFDTSQVTNLSYMFSGDGNLTDLNVSGFNTSNSTSMQYMFNGQWGTPVAV